MTKKVDIITLGCSKNLIDSERVMKMFTDAGITPRHNPDGVNADAVVINTCGFIGDAKEESIETILEVAEAKKRGDVGEIIVMGCLSERYRSELQAEIPEIDRIYGKFDWVSLVSDYTRKDVPESYSRIVSTGARSTYLKIAEGCNRYCAFCAIPLITGRYKSRSIEDIEQEVINLVASGVVEFNIIAQDLSGYGIDLYGEPKLADLVSRLSEIKGVEWLRLHYAYPAQFPYDVLEVMRTRSNVCSYLDIALQHISDPVLKNMRRHITGEETRELLRRIRKEVPGIHIRTTLMVGFPGEGEKEFEELKEFVKEFKFERMGAFAYCEEEDTYGARHYEDSIPPEIQEQRLSELMALQEEISQEIQSRKVGQEFRVLVDREEDEYFIGRTEFDSPEVDPEVLIEKSKGIKVGEFINVIVKEALPFELIAEKSL